MWTVCTARCVHVRSRRVRVITNQCPPPAPPRRARASLPNIIFLAQATGRGAIKNFGTCRQLALTTLGTGDWRALPLAINTGTHHRGFNTLLTQKSFAFGFGFRLALILCSIYSAEKENPLGHLEYLECSH